MEPTKDSKNTTKTTETKATTPVEKPEEEVVVVDNIDKDATVVTGQAGDEPVTVVMNPPKKHKVGLIVGIVVFLLFLIGAGSLAAWYFCIYNSPDVIAYDAMRQLMSAEHVSASGTIRIADTEADADGNINVAELELVSASMRLPSNINVNLNISERDRDDKIVDNHEISVGLSLTVLSDGTIYFKTSDLTATIDKALVASGSDIEDLDDISQFAYAIAELLDNQAWEISLGDVLEQMDLGSSISEPITDFYSCALSAAQENSDLAKLYDAHRFVRITKTDQKAAKDDSTRYQATVDYAALAGYVNALPETSGAEKAIACYNDLAKEFDFDTISTSDIPEISASDLEDELPSDYKLYLEIANFNHRLNRIEIEGSNDDARVNGNLDFDYSAVEITAPADSRPVTDLFEEVFELVGEYFYGVGGTGLPTNGVIAI